MTSLCEVKFENLKKTLLWASSHGQVASLHPVLFKLEKIYEEFFGLQIKKYNLSDFWDLGRILSVFGCFFYSKSLFILHTGLYLLYLFIYQHVLIIWCHYIHALGYFEGKYSQKWPFLAIFTFFHFITPLGNASFSTNIIKNGSRCLRID